MTSIRGYLTDKQYQQITGATTLGDNADAIISRAEQIIDGYVGNWQPAIREQYDGAAAAADENGMTMAPEHVQQINGVNYLKGAVVEFLTGDAAGLFRTITGQDALGGLTFDTVFTGSEIPAAGDIYHVYQAGKFPRSGTEDLRSIQQVGGLQYLRVIPARLREAVAYQVKYMQELGDTFFDGQNLLFDSETFSKYSYTKGDNAKGGKAIIAPKVRQILSGSGLVNRTARITGW